MSERLSKFGLDSLSTNRVVSYKQPFKNDLAAEEPTSITWKTEVPIGNLSISFSHGWDYGPFNEPHLKSSYGFGSKLQNNLGYELHEQKIDILLKSYSYTISYHDAPAFLNLVLYDTFKEIQRTTGATYAERCETLNIGFEIASKMTTRESNNVSDFIKKLTQCTYDSGEIERAFEISTLHDSQFGASLTDFLVDEIVSDVALRKYTPTKTEVKTIERYTKKTPKYEAFKYMHSLAIQCKRKHNAIAGQKNQYYECLYRYLDKNGADLTITSDLKYKLYEDIVEGYYRTKMPLDLLIRTKNNLGVSDHRHCEIINSEWNFYAMSSLISNPRNISVKWIDEILETRISTQCIENKIGLFENILVSFNEIYSNNPETVISLLSKVSSILESHKNSNLSENAFSKAEIEVLEKFMWKVFPVKTFDISNTTVNDIHQQLNSLITSNFYPIGAERNEAEVLLKQSIEAFLAVFLNIDSKIGAPELIIKLNKMADLLSSPELSAMHLSALFFAEKNLDIVKKEDLINQINKVTNQHSSNRSLYFFAALLFEAIDEVDKANTALTHAEGISGKSLYSQLLRARINRDVENEITITIYQNLLRAETDLLRQSNLHYKLRNLELPKLIDTHNSNITKKSVCAIGDSYSILKKDLESYSKITKLLDGTLKITSNKPASIKKQILFEVFYEDNKRKIEEKLFRFWLKNKKLLQPVADDSIQSTQVLNTSGNYYRALRDKIIAEDDQWQEFLRFCQVDQ